MSLSTRRRQVVARKVQILQQVKVVAEAAVEVAVLLIRSREIRGHRAWGIGLHYWNDGMMEYWNAGADEK